MILNSQTNLIAIVIVTFAMAMVCISANTSNSSEQGVCVAASANDPRYSEFKVALEKLYGQIGLDEKIDQEIFELSMIGYYNLKKRNLLQKESLTTGNLPRLKGFT